MNEEESQMEVNRLIKRGIVFGLVWFMGIGSAIALISGIQANKIINKSEFNLEGKKRANLCLVLGIIGILIWVPIVILIIVHNSKKFF